MANHYYRRSQARSRTRKRNPRSFTWLWILFGIFIGVGGTAVSYMMLMNPSKTSIAQIKRPVQKQVKKEKESPQRFEFYTLLPGMEIQLPDTHPVAPPKPAEKPIAESVQVVVQPQASPPPPPPAPITQASKPNTSSPIKSTGEAAHTPKLTAAQYIVQAGIFQKLEHADELKAQLTLQGFNTKIQKVQTQEGQTWFRVTLGPFASESLALNQKKRLESNKIHGILILQRPNS